jgi:adenosylmethionine-8-amino-7-oxononanoate aminotransferase
MNGTGRAFPRPAHGRGRLAVRIVDAFIVAPPLTSTDEELDELLARLRATLASLRDPR